MSLLVSDRIVRLAQEPVIVDLDKDIEDIPELPVCDFCCTADKLKTFDTYRELIQHRIDRHRSTPGPSIIVEPIEVQIQRGEEFNEFDEASESDIEAIFDDFEMVLNTPPGKRLISEYQLKLHYIQKNLRPID